MNVSDKKFFGTDGIRGRVGFSLINPEFMLKLGWAAGSVLAAKTEGRGKVLIGKDTRVSGYMLESALEAGLSAAGVDSHLLGPMPTPGIAYLTRTFRAAAGIVISASHNHYQDNGIKFFASAGCKLSDAIEMLIEEQLTQPMMLVGSADLGKAHRIKDAAGRYIEFCKSTVPSHASLNGLCIVVDCAHGATYHIAPDVFQELGAKVIAIGVEPNGFNINESGSTKLRTLQARVLAEKADLGIAFDGDGDRVLMVDHCGEIVDGDELLYIIAKESIEQKRLPGGVVGTQMSNLGLEIALQALGIPFKRSAVGDRYVMQMLQSLGWVLGGESSGHIICLQATTTGDGIVSALQVLYAMVSHGQNLHALKSGILKYPQILINVPVEEYIRLETHPKVQQAVKEIEAELGLKGRVLLRTSGTEPLIRVMVEGEQANQVQRLAQQLANTVRTYASS